MERQQRKEGSRFRGAVAAPLFDINSLPLEGKVPRRGGQGTGGMKENGEMRL